MGKTGGKNQKNKKRISRDLEKEKGELIFKEIGQEYAQILRMLGNGRCETYCFDGIKRLCHIRGKMRKKIWINIGDIVLIGIRDFQDQKGDIILKYSSGEARSLKAYGELPSSIQINHNENPEQDKIKNSFFDEGFDFEYQENLISE
ncbi:eif1A (nucleomorph) [Hemiselmis andersenii]|uniref:Eukaryotic translation initiation factor 4C n=1 Tax=Hemiselmis andersenii TaxID=464988 RepID=A9BKZ4_HEMAN|nr:eif1A [Hemiselmis andersenii]ABW98149.1 eif1A [Hemiselmis andersenii]|mmetsp:Transcript_19918/g.45884  ORF Transcript_19918/g.45884 Transcript_19918/m.45884 type:complete len:147 (+) Transcript_19918:72-512(+)